MASLYHISKEIISWKTSTETAAQTLVPGHFVFSNNEASLLLENKICTYIGMYLYRLCNSKVIEISPNEHGWHPQIPFYRFFEN